MHIAYSAKVTKVNRCAIAPTGDSYSAPSGQVSNHEITDACNDRFSYSGEQTCLLIVDRTTSDETVSSVLHTIVSSITETI
jgi:hypothetical protein